MLSIRNIDQGAIMKLNKILKNAFLVIIASVALSACAVSKKAQDKCKVMFILEQIPLNI